MPTLDEDVRAICLRARRAARMLAPKRREEKDAALHAIARELEASKATVLDANAADVAEAKSRGQTAALVDRLTLDDKRYAAKRPNGLSVKRVRVPLGVVAMVYESRPNVTVEASALTLKAGNAVVLRGGSEASRSNEALA